MMKKCFINSAYSIHPDGVVSGDQILHAVEPDYKDIITNANQRRRMSHIIKMGVAAGLLCLDEANNPEIDAIITATGLGCLADTEKFLNNIVDNQEELLNPTAFIQSTFNTIGAQIALIKGINVYNNTYVHRGGSFEGALLDAVLRICEGDKNVLIGAIDEATETSRAILAHLGMLDNIIMGEGAQFFILSDEPTDNSYAKLESVNAFSNIIEIDTLSNKINDLLEKNQLQKENIDCLMLGKNGHKEYDRIYDDVSAIFPNAKQVSFKDICGEYHTASSFALWKASILMKEDRRIRYTLIYNHYNNANHSLILLGQC